MKKPRVQQRTERRISAALRLVMVAVLLLAQIALVIVLSDLLKQRMALAYTVLQLLAGVVAMRIWSRPGATSYKMGWIILVLFVPVVGLILYLLWNGDRPSKRLSLKKPVPIEEPMAQQEIARTNLEKLRQTAPQWYPLAAYLSGKGFDLCNNTDCQMYQGANRATAVSDSAVEAVDGLYELGSSSYLLAGEEISFMDLMEYMLVASGNDAANALAIHISGSLSAFADLMNSTAQSLGCTGSHFVNPHGLHDEDHYTTARDLLTIAKAAMKNETIARLVGETEVTLPVTNKHDRTTTKFTTNYMLSKKSTGAYYYEGAIGIKTGSTEESGYCLVSSAKRSGRRLVAVVLGCKGNGATVESFSESAKLYNWAYNNFSMRQVAATDELYRQPVALSKQTDTVMLYPAQSVEAFLPKDAKDEDIRKSVTLKQDVVNAPVTAGQELGTLTITYNDQVCAEVPLLAQADVSASRFLVAKAAVEAFFAKTWVKLALVAVVVLVIVFILWLKLGRRSRRYGSRGGKRRQRRAYRGRRRW